MSNNTASDPTNRFSSRVAYYIKHRPNYPAEILTFMREELVLLAASVIADVGSGTGILAEMFLKNDNPVFCVEPNKEMREAAENLLKEYPNFNSIVGTAESTALEPHSVDFITAGQAFHWFDAHKSRAEFVRIKRPGGWTVLMWNVRKTDSTPFLQAYEDLLRRRSIDYQETAHRTVHQEALHQLFGSSGYKAKVFANSQTFDYEDLKGRVLSSSYAPMEGHPNYKPMMEELERMFHQHQTGGTVSFEYDTEVYYGQLT